MESGRGVSVSVPESEGIGSDKRQFDVEGETGGDLVQDLCAIHGLGPRLDALEFDGARLFVVAQWPEFCDFGVEGFDTDAKTFRFGFACAVVVGGGQTGEALEGFLVRGRQLGTGVVEGSGSE